MAWLDFINNRALVYGVVALAFLVALLGAFAMARSASNGDRGRDNGGAGQ